jgi:hypothetical protein
MSHWHAVEEVAVAVVTAEVVAVVTAAAAVVATVVEGEDISAVAAVGDISAEDPAVPAAALAAPVLWAACRVAHFEEAAWGALAWEAWLPAGAWEPADFAVAPGRPVRFAQGARGECGRRWRCAQAAWEPVAWGPAAWEPVVWELVVSELVVLELGVQGAHSSPVIPVWEVASAAVEPEPEVRSPPETVVEWAERAWADARASVAAAAVRSPPETVVDSVVEDSAVVDSAVVDLDMAAWDMAVLVTASAAASAWA